jgi:glycerol-3-phosphate acyltransferase PlsY
VSLSSILGALGFCVSFLIFHWHKPVVAAMGVVIGLLAIFMHRANIKRLLSGQEKKATFSKFKKQK